MVFHEKLRWKSSAWERPIRRWKGKTSLEFEILGYCTGLRYWDWNWVPEIGRRLRRLYGVFYHPGADSARLGSFVPETDQRIALALVLGHDERTYVCGDRLGDQLV